MSHQKDRGEPLRVKSVLVAGFVQTVCITFRVAGETAAVDLEVTKYGGLIEVYLLEDGLATFVAYLDDMADPARRSLQRAFEAGLRRMPQKCHYCCEEQPKEWFCEPNSGVWHCERCAGGL